METQDLLDLFRKQVSDEEKPFLWDDVERLQYLIDAQDTFVRKMGGFSDYSTSALTDIQVTKGQPLSKFSKYILRIRSIKLLTQRRNVTMISEADLKTKARGGEGIGSMLTDYGMLSPSLLYLDDLDIGPVYYAVIGVQDNALRWHRVPDQNDIARMHIYRLPYPRMKDEESCLEIDEQHHIALIMWMKYLAYSKEDAETYDRDLAEINRVGFVTYCDEAKAEKDRQRFKPRVIHYGGF